MVQNSCELELLRPLRNLKLSLTMHGNCTKPREVITPLVYQTLTRCREFLLSYDRFELRKFVMRLLLFHSVQKLSFYVRLTCINLAFSSCCKLILVRKHFISYGAKHFMSYDLRTHRVRITSIFPTCEIKFCKIHVP